MPREQAPFLGSMTFYVRSELAPSAVRTAVEQVVARQDATLPIMDFRTVAEQARENVFLDRFMSTLAVALGDHGYGARGHRHLRRAVLRRRPAAARDRAPHRARRCAAERAPHGA